MPLVAYSLAMLDQQIRLQEQWPDCRKRILCLSCPDLIIPAKMPCMFLPPGWAAELPVREDSEQIIRWHKAWNITNVVYDTKAFFAAMGWEMTSLDIVAGRGTETLFDLNTQLPEQFANSFDVVFDCISNQCFNVAQALWNAVYACREGGSILSVTPVTMINQGFWDISPAAYHDFAAANELTLTSRFIHGVYENKGELDLSRTARQREIPDDVMNVMLMYKRKHHDQPTWPIMSKFVRFPTCKLDTDQARL